MSENETPTAPIEGQAASDPVGAAGPSPEPPAPPASARGAGSGGNQKVLIVLGAAILSILVVAASFGLGYAIGDRDNGAPALGARIEQRAAEGIGAARQGARGRLREMVEGGEASLVRGSVSSIKDGTITVETEDGQQTVSLTDRTRYVTAGGTDGGPNAIEAGEQVRVLARKADDGGLQAVVVRIGAPVKEEGRQVE